MDFKLSVPSGSFQSMRVSRDHTRQKWQVLTDHLVQTFITDVETQARARAEADLAKVSQPARARPGFNWDSTLAAQGPQRPHGSCGPRFGAARRVASGSLEQPGRKGPQPGVAATFRPAPRGGRDPEPCRARRPPLPNPPVVDGTAGSHTPCRGPGLGRPCRRRAAATARGVRYARPKAARVTSGGR